jgi:hypothetical protein
VSREPESRLEALFAGLPEPGEEVTERALARALAALPTGRRPFERPVRAVVFMLAGVLVVLAVSAGALAAAGALHVSFGRSALPRQPQAASVPELAVPTGAAGIAATIDGRLWLTTRGGLRLQGLPVSAATLSPHALYVAVGVGNTLVAMAPDGRRAWSHPTAGTVAAIAWAPDGLRIAYVVHVGGRFRLYLIEGNGRRGQLIDAAVRPARPSWRADSLALGYLAAGGRPLIYDLGHRSHTPLGARTARDASQVAFAPVGGTLALATAHAVVLIGSTGPAETTRFSDGTVAGLGWFNHELAVAVNPTPRATARPPSIVLFRVARSGVASEIARLTAPAPIEALDASGTQMTIALATRGGGRILAVPRSIGAGPLLQSRVLLQLHPPSRIDSLEVR